MEGATKCKITYNSDGIVTGGSDLEMSDLPSQMSTTYVLKNTDITPVPAGSFKCKVRYDAKGLVLEGADLSASDIERIKMFVILNKDSLLKIANGEMEYEDFLNNMKRV